MITICEFHMSFGCSIYIDDNISIKSIRLSRHLIAVRNTLCIGIRWKLWLWNTAATADAATAAAAATAIVHIHVFIIGTIIARIEINSWRWRVTDAIVVDTELWWSRYQIWARGAGIQWTFPIAARTTPAIIMLIVYMLMVSVFIVDDLKL